MLTTQPWMVAWASLSLALAGCLEARPKSGTVACDPKTRACPGSYYCAVDNTCWRNGIGPGQGDGGGVPDGGVPDGGAGTNVHVVITADNAYAFGWGDATQVSQLLGRPAVGVWQDIFSCPIGHGELNSGPEAYDVPAKDAPVGAYLYIVAWSDQITTQGVLGQFDRGGTALYTGDPRWEVCATGKPYNSSTSAGAAGPPIAEVNAKLAECNAGSGSTTNTSAGWVNAQGAVTAGAKGELVVGEDNSDAAGDFIIACQQDGTGARGIDPDARWMWYRPTTAVSAFRYNATVYAHSFFIFRLSADAVPPIL